jgi:hypothetical protein
MGGDFNQYSIGEFQTPVVAVVMGLEDVTGTDPADLKSLHHTINTDALNSLIDSGTPEVTVEFEHEGCDVVVRADKTVLIKQKSEE